MLYGKIDTLALMDRVGLISAARQAPDLTNCSCFSIILIGSWGAFLPRLTAMSNSPGISETVGEVSTRLSVQDILTGSYTTSIQIE